MKDLLIPTPAGLYCPQGDFYIDPRDRVQRAVITHAHSDHARRGCRSYLAALPSKELLRQRLGGRAHIEALRYGESINIRGVRVSLHPAGHILGSAQVRLEYRGEVWVVSGDYKLQQDPTCEPFEPVRCDVFLTESTFGLPKYNWPAPEQEIARLEAWWRANQTRQVTSIVLAYSIGKAQRILASVNPEIGPIVVHDAVARHLEAYRATGVRLPKVKQCSDPMAILERGRCLLLAPPGARRSRWWQSFRPCAWAWASGWVLSRPQYRMNWGDSEDKSNPLVTGFIISDHADWPGLQRAIELTGAQTVWVTHGYTESLAAWLRHSGRTAVLLE
ncbi:MAG: ligase-associated DNA damage response exonuclease [Gemmatales bacterium]|nr:ligase-associated DNA damage response exonuclease [Gemmatales bacterium]MDW8222488.1 ligase-associated DNA damage response exonuclease [Gemmatales bacterium]